MSAIGRPQTTFGAGRRQACPAAKSADAPYSELGYPPAVLRPASNVKHWGGGTLVAFGVGLGGTATTSADSPTFALVLPIVRWVTNVRGFEPIYGANQAVWDTWHEENQISPADLFGS